MGRVIVVDSGFQEGLLRVDGTTGDRTFFSGCTDGACTPPVGDGPLFDDPFRVNFAAPAPPVAVPLLGTTSTLVLLAAFLVSGSAAIRRRHES